MFGGLIVTPSTNAETLLGTNVGKSGNAHIAAAWMRLHSRYRYRKRTTRGRNTTAQGRAKAAEAKYPDRNRNSGMRNGQMRSLARPQAPGRGMPSRQSTCR